MKITVKLFLIIFLVTAIEFLAYISDFALFLLIVIFVVTVVLLIIIIEVLVTEIRVLQLLKIRKKSKNDRRCTYLRINYNDIDVNYLWHLNGGGLIFAHEFVRIITKKIGKVTHIFEYCSGPGFIGFNLLANNLCQRLTLADVNPQAIKAATETIKDNFLQDKVNVYESDCLDSIPESEQWDLVVSNPPWDLSARNKEDIMVCDPRSRVHIKFYQTITKYLKPDGSILFIEGGEYTRVTQFLNIIQDNGFRIVEIFRPPSFFEIFRNKHEYTKIKTTVIIFLRLCLFFRETYFIWVKRQDVLGSLNQS